MFGKKKNNDAEEEIFATLPEYDFERDGSLVNPKLRNTDEVLEAYWIEPGLTRVSIIRTTEYENIYIAHEPALTPFEADLLERIQPAVRDMLILKDVEVSDMKEVLYDLIDSLLDSYDLPITAGTVYKLRYYLKRTFFGWGRVDILRGDHEIEDISCSGYDLPVYLYHRKYRDIKTSIFFSDPRELDSQVVLFAQKAGKHISLSNPIVDATLSDGSRIQLTYSLVVTTRGSSFTIRKFRKNPFSPIDLLVNKTFTLDEMVYLWMAVQYNFSILIIGGTASGKTTTMNAISQFIPALSKVVSIEDTREIMLDHDNWIASLVPLSSGAGNAAQRDISMFDLLKAAMRQRPEYILVGEVRGIEAQTLFQAMNSGHTTYSTLHAGNVTMAIHRLQNPPLDVPKATIETLDIVLSQGSMFLNKKQVRRCKEITEIVGMTDAGDLEINTVYLYNFQKDEPIFSGNSNVYSKISEKTGMTMSMLNEDIRRRKSILQAMLNQDIRDYRDFARIIWLYLSKPKYVLANVGELVEVLPGKCKLYESLANRKIGKDEYPERVNGPAESDAAYKAGSSISDPTGIYAKARVCYIPEPSGLSGTKVAEVPAPVPAPVSISGNQAPIVDSVPIIDADESGPKPDVSEDETVSYNEEDQFFNHHAPVAPEEDLSESELESGSSFASESEISLGESGYDDEEVFLPSIHAPFPHEEDLSVPSDPGSEPSSPAESEVSEVGSVSYDGAYHFPDIHAPFHPEKDLSVESEPEPSPSAEPEVSEDEPGSNDGEDNFSEIPVPVIPEADVSEPEFEPEPSPSAEPDVSADDYLYYSGEHDFSDIPTPVVPEEEPSRSPEPVISAVSSAPDDEEDHLYDIHAPIVSDEDRFGPPEQKTEPLFELDRDKELSSFDLYADEPTKKIPPKKTPPKKKRL